ncbi:arylalkylamine N-acetyltransferase-like 2 [Uranotaenia lowii]|uniref:arylalkylamine N-acetyltransferase-like 2 n=1 Tax=Uranotaenia lowii TaxID=190385 RepID=UPI00247944E4|nr:arylalkylamine N-acetyltransferase-like 2 [Uranotaenia lowii]
MIGLSSCVRCAAVSLLRNGVNSRIDLSSSFQSRCLSLASLDPQEKENLLQPTLFKGFLYRLATSDDRDQIRDGLERWFYPGDPVGSEHRDGPQYVEEDMDWMLGLIEHGIVIVAHEKSSGSFAGFCGAQLIGPDYVPEMIELAKTAETRKFRDICLFLAHCTRNANIFERYQIETAYQTPYTSVDPKFRGRKLGSVMMDQNLEIAKILGAGAIYGDCTGPYMARSCQRIGMRCVYEIAYRDYRDENGEIVFKTKPGYEYLQCHAMKLT